MSPDNAKERIKNDERNLEVDVLVGLLDFHSDRAEAQASFLVACIFGSFTLLAVVQTVQIEFWMFLWLSLLAIPYWAIAAIGFHCLQRFSFYASMAETVRSSLVRYVECIPEGKMHARIYAAYYEKGVERRMPLKECKRILLEDYGYRGILDKFKKPLIRKLAAIAIFGLPFAAVYLIKISHTLFRL